MALDPTNLLSTPQGYASPEQLQSMRDYAKVLATPQKNITHWTQGMSNVVGALMGGVLSNQADTRQRQAREGQAAALESAFQIPGAEVGGGLGGGPPLATGGRRVSEGDVPPSAAEAKQFFIDKGYTPEVAAGIVGNLIQESDLNPKLTHDGGIGLGIAGWNGPRLAALKQFAAQRGTDPTDYNTQLEFVHQELQGPEKSTALAMQSAKTPEEAASAFIGFERPQGYRPGQPQGASGYSRRLALAGQVAGYPAGAGGGAAPAAAAPMGEGAMEGTAPPAPAVGPNQQYAQALAQGQQPNLAPSDQLQSMARTISALVRTGAMEPSEGAKLLATMRTQFLPTYSADAYGREIVSIPGRPPQFTGRQMSPGKEGEYGGYKTFETIGPDGKPVVQMVPPPKGAEGITPGATYSTDSYGREIVAMPGRPPQFTGRQLTPGKEGEFQGLKTFETIGPDGKPQIQIVPPGTGHGAAPAAPPAPPAAGGAPGAAPAPPAAPPAPPGGVTDVPGGGVPSIPPPGSPPEAYIAWQQGVKASQEAANEGSKKLAEAHAKPIAETIDRGGQKAQDLINVFDRMADAYKSGGISGGPLGEGIMKLKELGNQVFGGEWKGLAETEVVRKSTSELAAKVIKEMSARGGTQMEFKNQLENNPGITMSNKGALYMIDILRQQAVQDQELAAAATGVTNPRQWPAVMKQYYETHPLKSPFTGQPLTGDAIKQDLAALKQARAESPLPTSKGAPAEAGEMPAGLPPDQWKQIQAQPGYIKALRDNADNPAMIQSFNKRFGPGSAEAILGRPFVPQSR